MAKARGFAAIPLVLVLALAMFVEGCGGESEGGLERKAAKPSGAKLAALPATGDLLLVVRGPVTVDGSRLAVDTAEVEWFTDRPQRRAGVAPVSELVARWQSYFAGDPPNAALAGANLDTVIELTSPRITDGGISFGFEVLRGQLAPNDLEDLGDLSLFIDNAGAALSCQQEVLSGQAPAGSDVIACKFQLTQSSSFTVNSLAQAACTAWNNGSNCSEFMAADTPILVQAWGGGGGGSPGWGLYDGGGGGSAGYAQTVQPYSEVGGQTWYAYVGGGGSHDNNGGTGGMASLVLSKPLSQASSGDLSSAVVIAGGGGGGGPANSDGNGYGGGNGGQAWAAGDASSHGGPYTTGSGPAGAFGPGATTGGTVATSYNSDGFVKGAGCGAEFDEVSDNSGNHYACGGSLSVDYVPNVNDYSFDARAGVGGEPTEGGTGGNGSIAPVGGDVSDKSMSYSNFAGGTAIDSGLASASLGEGGDGHKGGAGGGGGYGGGGGSGPNYTCGHDGVRSFMYCGAAGGGSYADGSSLGSSKAAPSSWYGNLSTSGSSRIVIWIASL